MVDIRPNQLPPAILPLRETDELIVDQGVDGVRKAPPVEAINSVAPVSTQAEAIAGLDNIKRMTPLRTKESIASEVGVSIASKASLDLKANDSIVVKSVNGILPVLGDVSVSSEDTRLQNDVISASSINYDDNVFFIITAGYSAAGDGGGATYKYVTSEPSHAGKFQSTDEKWWELFTDIANVKMFGAKGDGLTDDYRAIQNAVEFAQSNKVGVVYFPEPSSKYLVGTTIINDCSKPLTFKGDGRGLSKLQGGVGVNPVLKIGSIEEYRNTPQRVMDMAFDYPGQSDASQIKAEACILDVFNVSTQGGRNAVSLDDVFSFCISDCSFGNSRGAAIYSGSASTGHNSRITSNGFFGCGNANSAAAIYILTSDNVLIEQNQIEGCYRAFELSGCTAARIVSNYMEYGHDPFYFGVSSRRNSSVIMEGNWIAAYDNPTYIEYVDGLFFRGNTIWSQTIGFGPAANSSNVCVGQNTLLAGGVINNPPWNLLTAINGWVTGSNPIAVNMTSDGQVSIRGFVTRSSGSGNQTVCILPNWARPNTPKRTFGVNNAGAAVLILLDVNGNLYAESGVSFTGSVYIDITFLR